MAELKSNIWSSETLVRGMAGVAEQPFGLLSMTYQDADLKAEYLDPRQKKQFRFAPKISPFPTSLREIQVKGCYAKHSAIPGAAG